MSIGKQYRPVTIGRIFFALTILLSPRLSSQNPEFSVHPAQERVEVVQGNILGLGFIVSNNSRQTRDFSATLALPQGWRPVIRETPFRVSASGQETRLVSISFPPETNAGRYEVIYRLADASKPGQVAEGRVEIVIRPSRQLELKLIESPRFVVAGVEYAALFQVDNPGNVRSRVRLSARNSDGFRSTLDSTVVTLGAKESRIITALVRTISSIKGKVVNTLEVNAVIVGDSSITARASAVVEVIPQVNEADEKYLNYPVMVTGRLAGEDERLGGQIEVSGAGSLSESGTDRLEVYVRTTDIQSQSSLAVRDEYRIRYTSRFGEVRIGDWNFSLSPLTEFSRHAFGAGGSARIGNATIGGFYNQSRFYTPVQTEAAAFVAYDVVEGVRLGVNHLNKQDDLRSSVLTERRQVQASVSSVRGEFQVLGLANVDAEYAMSEAAGTRDQAVSAQVTGRHSWGAFDLRTVNAGTNYRGYYRDLDFTSLSFSTTPLEDVTTEFYFRTERRNKSNDTTLFYVPLEQFVQVGAGYSNLVAMYFRSTRQKDLLPVPQYDRLENTIQLRLSRSLWGVNLYSNMDFGSARDRLLSRDFPFQRYALYAGFSPVPAQTYNVSLEYSRENDLFSGEKLKRLSMSVGGSFFIGEMTNIQGTVYWNRTFATTRQEFGLIDVVMRHEFPNRHQIAVRGRQNYFVPAVRTRELAYELQYSVPVAIPLKRLSSNGQIRGRVVDEKNMGMRNVLINIGSAAAITESDGSFYFPSLAPGKHYVIIDKGSIGLDRVTLQTMPIEVNIRGGEERPLTINVVRGVTIRATVRFRTFVDSDTGEVVKEIGPRSGILLEATNGRDLHRRVTDSRGNAVFAELKPGNWTVRAVGGDIPLYHAIERDIVEIKIAGGETRTTDFVITPRKRTIRIIETVDVPVVQSEPEKTADPADPCVISYEPRLSGYVLQVSSWATRSKASERKRVAENVTGKSSWIERVSLPGIGVRYRVKVGAFASLAEAEIQCRKLNKIEAEPAHD